MTPMDLRKNVLQEIASLLDNEEAMTRVYAYLLSLKGEGLAEHIPGLPYTKEELGHACGRAVCAMAAITDVALARAFVNALGQPEKYAELLADLDRRVERVQQRRREEKAHRNNIKHGKK